ncbi:hypothetical protein Cgig2_032074 [Carnegiea gigantea]|uniref:Uncharacterized protein n=1 Tax=Carnegiea gigantea TaxID=171969 RepID=A0A9Q1JZS6_9CARY|nr:hypothetical protein Cgig2_032074 [Carnegiea gigantea]
MAEGAAWCFELPKLSQVIFYAILLSKANRLGVLQGQTLHIMESALTELRWSTFEAWVWLNGDRILEARFREEAEQEDESSDAEEVASLRMTASRSEAENKRERERERALLAPFIMAFPPLHDTREMADFMKESFRRHCRSATHPPYLLPDDYWDLCPTLRYLMQRATLYFELPEMVQATFYIMLLNDAVELGIVSDSMAINLKLTLEGLRWASFDSCLSHNSCDLMETKRCQRTPLEGARTLVNGQEERSGSDGPPPPSSDEE